MDWWHFNKIEKIFLLIVMILTIINSVLRGWGILDSFLELIFFTTLAILIILIIRKILKGRKKKGKKQLEKFIASRKRKKKKRRESKAIIIIIVVLGLFLTAFIISYLISEDFEYFEKTTTPAELLNKSRSELVFINKKYTDFNTYYEIIKKGEESEFEPLQTQVPKFPQLEYGLGTEEGYLDECEKKQIKINFSNFRTNNFEFNYSNKMFNYRINLYDDMELFSSNLKKQDCYYEEETDTQYYGRYLKDLYNNAFVEAISKDFESLKEKGFSKDEILEIATVFIQSIPYGSDITEHTNRFPYETLAEGEGNCLDKSVILAGIAKNLGYETYIILGESENEFHAIVGVACDKGNIKHGNSEICFIETTNFFPIAYDSDIDIEIWIEVSLEGTSYSGVNYGNNLVDFIDMSSENYQRIDNLLAVKDSELNNIEKKMNDLQEIMCYTDCITCRIVIIEGTKTIEVISELPRCEGANTYNTQVRQYNEFVDLHNLGIDDYNKLVNEWYMVFYEMEIRMFENVEYLERKK